MGAPARPSAAENDDAAARGVAVQTLRPAEPRERRPWWMHALAAAGISQGGKVDDRDAAALRQAEEGDPGADGGHYFEYRPPWGRTVFQIPSAPGPCRPFDEDCAVEIIQKSPPISHRHPLDENETAARGVGEPSAPPPPVPASRRSASTECDARPLHARACSLP